MRRIGSGRFWLLAASLSTSCTSAPSRDPFAPVEESVGGASKDQDGDAEADEDPGADESGGASPGGDDASGDGRDDGTNDQENDAGLPDASVGGDLPDALDCSDETARAAQLIEARCGSCHGNGRREGGFGEAGDIDAIVARGFVRLGSPANSEIFQITESGEMPEGSPRLNDQEMSVLSDWISCVPQGVDPGAGGGAGDGDVGSGGDEDDEDDEDDEADED